MKVRIFDVRHYSRNKVTGKEFQLPTAQGVWEMQQLMEILIGGSGLHPDRPYGSTPDCIATSPQPRAWLMAELIANALGWINRHLVERYDEFNDISSDPAIKELGIVDAYKAYAQQHGVSAEAALLLDPTCRQYMWERSDDGLIALTEIASQCEDDGTAVIFSHGGQVEMRFLRLLHLSRSGIDFGIEEQHPDMINVDDLNEFGGMLQTGEGFSYTLEIKEGRIVDVSNLSTIRLPTVPAEIADHDD